MRRFPAKWEVASSLQPISRLKLKDLQSPLWFRELGSGIPCIRVQQVGISSQNSNFCGTTRMGRMYRWRISPVMSKLLRRNPSTVRGRPIIDRSAPILAYQLYQHPYPQVPVAMVNRKDWNLQRIRCMFNLSMCGAGRVFREVQPLQTGFR